MINPARVIEVVADILSEHEACSDIGHRVVLTQDGEVLIKHKNETEPTDMHCCDLTINQCRHGLNAKEWSVLVERVIYHRSELS